MFLTSVNHDTYLQLYTQRSSVVKNKEKEGWSQIDFRYMTDESDGEADGTKETHQPTWRSSGMCKSVTNDLYKLFIPYQL